MKSYNGITIFIFAIIWIAIALALQGIIAFLLWNALMPQIFNLPVLTFWQALGLVFLSNCFFRDSWVKTKKD